jgi:hypothetical protein
MDPVVDRIQTSRDIVFDDSYPFYPRPSTDAPLASVIGPLFFLLFPDASPAPLPISHSTLTSSLIPPSVSSSESSPMVPDYTVIYSDTVLQPS